MDRKLLLLILLGTLTYGANFWGTSIYILDEAKNAGCAMEMSQRNDFVVPTFNEALRTDKPPLHYFFMMGAYYAFGITPFSARLGSVIMGILLIAAGYVIVKKLIGETPAFFFALILIVSIQLSVQFHLAVPDPYLLFFLTTGLLCFYAGYHFNSVSYFYIFYTCISLATLVKGPVAIIIPGMIVLFFLLAQKKFTVDEMKRIKIFPGILIFCIIVLPWYIAVGILTDGAWLEGFFIKHNLARFTSTMEGHRGFPMASLVIVLAALVPFSFFAPQALAMAWQKRKEDSFLLFNLIASAVVVLFFAFSKTILPSYPEPAVPFLAILIGYYFAQQKGNSNSSQKWSAIIWCFISFMLPVAAWVALKNDPSLGALSFSSFYFIVLSISAIVALWWVFKKKMRYAVYSYAIGSFVFIQILFYTIFPNIDAQNPVVQGIPFLQKAELQVAAYKDFNPAFVFALKRTIPTFNSIDDLQHFVAKNGNGYILTQQRYSSEVKELGYKVVFEKEDLFETQVTVILAK